MGERVYLDGIWQTTVDGSGRVLVPAHLRHELHASKGTTLLWVRNDEGIHLKTFEQSLSEIQSYYGRLSPKEDVWSEEIIARRRSEVCDD